MYLIWLNQLLKFIFQLSELFGFLEKSRNEFEIYWQTLKTQHLVNSFNLCLEKEGNCMLKSIHLSVKHGKLVQLKWILRIKM